MAIYKFAQYLEHSNHRAFDGIHSPGTPTPHSGIYRCAGCGVNEVSTAGHPLPPQNHHQHRPGLGPIRWQIAVSTC